MADGASRSRSAGVGRGGARRDGSLRARFLRAWSGPQAASSVRRACVPAGPLQEAGYDFLSICGRSTRSHEGSVLHDGPLSLRSVGLTFRHCAQARAWFIYPGWEKFAIACGGNYTGGEQVRSPRAPGLGGDLQGPGEADARPIEPDRRALSWVRDGPDDPWKIPVLSPLGGEGGPAQGLQSTGVHVARSPSAGEHPSRTSPAGSRPPVHTTGMGGVCPRPWREFHSREGGKGPGPSPASDTLTYFSLARFLRPVARSDGARRRCLLGGRVLLVGAVGVLPGEFALVRGGNFTAGEGGRRPRPAGSRKLGRIRPGSNLRPPALRPGGGPRPRHRRSRLRPAETFP